MSKSTRSKTLKKVSDPTNDLVSNFINEPKQAEAVPSKRRKIDENGLDDSLKLFKPPNPRAAKSSEATSSNVATNFINESSKKSRSTVVKTKPKAAKTSKRKPKTQPDIRKVLSKQEQLYNQVVNESCLQDGLDPDEMQLALAISESLKDQNHLKDDDGPSTSSGSTKFENPFYSMGKVQPISAVLQRFGFKSKTNYSEYELDLLTNSKTTKRSKFTKFPTLLTRTSNAQRTQMIQEKIDDVLDRENRRSSIDFRRSDKFEYKVFSFYLQEMQENARTTFATSSEDRPTDEILVNYYVTELFEPSFVKAGHLLKDWRKIAGRDLTPERQNARSSQAQDGAESLAWAPEKENVQENANEVPEIDHESIKSAETSEDLKSPAKVVQVLSTSCEDIFADLEDFEIDDDYFTPKAADACVGASKESSEELNEHLGSLHVKLSQSLVFETADELIPESLQKLVSLPSLPETLCDEEEKSQSEEFLNESSSSMVVEVEDADNIDLTFRENSQSEVSIPYDDSYYSLQQHMKQFNQENNKEVRRVSRKPMSPPVSLSPEKEVEVVAQVLTQEETIEIGSDLTIELEQQELEVPELVHSPSKSSQVEEEPKSPVASQNSFVRPVTPAEINLISSEEDAFDDNVFMNLNSFHTTNENLNKEDDAELALSQNSTQNSLFDEDEVIAISDEEINYSMRRFHKRSDDQSEDFYQEAGGSKEEDAIDLTQVEDEMQQCSQVEINNLVEQSLIKVMGAQEVFDINDTISSLLEASVRTSNLDATRSNESMKLLQNEGLSDSLQDIMARYGATMEAQESPRSFRKMQSDSNLMNESVKRRNTYQFEIEDDEEIVDLTQPLVHDEAKEISFNNMSIHQSLENILRNTPNRSRTQVQRQRPAKKSLGVQIDDDYNVDTECTIPEPEYSTMTPFELKQALFKYGIRPLPVKKAVKLLEFFYDQLYPKILVAADEEIDANDTRRVMNITDIVTNIGFQEDDEFVFQPGLVEAEEIVLPKWKKSKTSSCTIPLHISFYNMVRSNEKIQRFILEFRPIELDLVYKHFRKFGLSYELNDIISFLDRRCITFKTKEKSYSKTHERKKQKRTQKS